MNKTELIEVVAQKADLKKKDAEAAVNAVFAAFEDALAAGEKVQLIGFGTYEVKDVPAKMGVNPSTGEKVAIPESKKPVLKFGKAYKDLFN